MLQISLILAGYMVLVVPVGWYLYCVAEQKPTCLDRVFDPVDRAIYRLCGIDGTSLNWKNTICSLLLTNAVMVAVGYAVLRLQGSALLNPNHIGGMASDVSFNTVISFMTNTNLQHYSGESDLSYLGQMLVVTSMMFTSAATGYAACMMFLRGITGMSGLGNYYVDMVRLITRVLLPLAFILGLALVFQGVPQTLGPNATVTTVENGQQTIALGPMASLVSIKHLGTNGGGFLGANSSAPQENPTILSNILELYAMMLLPGACVVVFGCMLRGQARNNVSLSTSFGEARMLFLSMGLLFLLGLTACVMAEKAGNPLLAELGLSQAGGTMEGKETRFGIEHSALFATVTTAFSTGSINTMHDSLSPLGGMVPLLLMLLNVVFGGVGAGLMNMMMYVLLAVFLCGLMVGRTPEYLGKKVEVREMRLTMLVLILHPVLVLGCTALAVSVPAGLAGITNPGFHGLTQVFYEYASSAANNGSGFEGLADNTLFWNLTTAFAMFYGRYVPIILQLCIAGSMLAKQRNNASTATLRTDTLTFAMTLSLLVLIFTALTYLPALALGPIAEHLSLWR